MDETKAILVGIILVLGVLIGGGRALDRRAASRGKPLPDLFSKQGLPATGLLLFGGLIVVVGAVVFDSWPVQIVGIIVGFSGAALRWYWRLHSQS